MRRAFKEDKNHATKLLVLLQKKAVCKKANGQGRDLSNLQIATYFFI